MELTPGLSGCNRLALFPQLINLLSTSETETERQETLWERQWGPSVGKMIAENPARRSEAERKLKITGAEDARRSGGGSSSRDSLSQQDTRKRAHDPAKCSAIAT